MFNGRHLSIVQKRFKVDFLSVGGARGKSRRRRTMFVLLGERELKRIWNRTKTERRKRRGKRGGRGGENDVG